MSLRLAGNSFRYIEQKLGIPRSTLSGWFENIKLSDEQTALIRKNWVIRLINSRQKAIKWHNDQKEIRIEAAKNEARLVLDKIDYSNNPTLELALAMLYLGEGSKRSPSTSLGNSDPKILNFYLFCIDKLYGVKRHQVKCYLHLRADQSTTDTKKYWSKQLKIPLENFMAATLDKRTVGKPTYDTYHGVCIISFGQIAIQRRLLWISKLFCEKIGTMRA